MSEEEKELEKKDLEGKDEETEEDRPSEGGEEVEETPEEEEEEEPPHLTPPEAVFDYKEPEEILKFRNSLENTKFKIAVLGGRDGVGASTITANLALSMADGYEVNPEEYPHVHVPGVDDVETEGESAETGPQRLTLRVGIIDLDFINGHSISRILGMKDALVKVTDEGILPPVGPAGIKVISLGMLLGDPFYPRRYAMEDWNILLEVLSRVEWGTLDVLLIDLPASIDRFPEPFNILLEVDASIVVTLPKSDAAAPIRRAWKFADYMSMPLIGMVSNMTGVFKGGDIEEMSNKFGTPLHFEVPFKPELASTSNGEKPYLLNRDTAESKAFNDFTYELVDYLFWIIGEQDDELED